MTAEGWYWCFTHDRVEAAGERDDPDNVLGPYPTAEAAADWRSTTEQRDDAWKDADKAWSGDDDADEGA
jgi:hypothetical protein